MQSSRRQFMTGTAVAGAAIALQGSDAFAAGQGQFDAKLLRSEADVFKDVEYLANLGPRYCGNKAHNTYVQFLEDELVKCGLTLSSIPHNALVQWLPRNVTLKSGGQSIPIGAFCRWSATTMPEGVTAPIKYIGKIEGASRFDWQLYPERRGKLQIPADVKGKIALVEIGVDYRPLGLMFDGKVRQFVDKDKHQPFPLKQGPSASNMAATPDGFESDLKKAGAVGLIYAWTGLADDDALGQSRLGTDALPSIWVTPTTGKQLRQIAEAGTPVNLTVEADIAQNYPTRTIVATLPGASDESIILWTHTDGPNALQENGGIALVNMMRYFAKLPKQSRKRTLVVVMPESHFAEQYVSTSAWVKERPELCQKTVALVAAEHLGGKEYLSDPVANTYKPSGKHEVAFAFCPTTPMQAAAKKAVAGQKIGRQAVLGTDQYSFTPGIAAYKQVKVPTFAYISIPSYLMADVPNGHIDKLDPKLYHEQLKMLIRLVHGLDGTPASVLKQA